MNALVEVVSAALELSPAVGIMAWFAWRADERAQQCLDRLIEHLDREH